MATNFPKQPGRAIPKVEYNRYQQITDFLHYGPHNPLFLEREKMCGEFIKQQNLKKIETTVAPQAAVKGIKKTLDIAQFEPWWLYGMVKFAHIHYKDEVYSLNDDQWKQFSQKVLTNFNEILAKAGTVNFQQVLKISEVVSKEVMG